MNGAVVAAAGALVGVAGVWGLASMSTGDRDAAAPAAPAVRPAAASVREFDGLAPATSPARVVRVVRAAPAPASTAYAPAPAASPGETAEREDADDRDRDRERDGGGHGDEEDD